MQRMAMLGKLAASAMFLALALSSYPWERSTWEWSRYVAVGLGFGALGDALLLSKRKSMFASGLSAFLVSHLLYCAGMTAKASWLWWPLLVPLLPTGLVLFYLWPHLGRLRVAVVLYMAAISLMLASGITTWSQTGEAGLLLAAGLFYASDFFVARNRFVVPGWHNRLVGLPLYYAGQLLFAYSVAN